MEPITFFVLQFLWFMLAWSLIAYYVIWPWSLRLPLHKRLSLWIAPQAFRVLGIGLLVPNLSPGMPLQFAFPTAIADSLTAVLAVLAFVGLQRGWRSARTLAWSCTLVGMSDLLIAFPHAAHTGAVAHLATQWYVPVLAGPVMVVCHIACLTTLLRSRGAAGRGGTEERTA